MRPIYLEIRPELHLVTIRGRYFGLLMLVSYPLSRRL